MHDLHQALRRLGKTPGFAVAAVLLLGLGIGASTSIFSVVQAVLLEPIAPDQDRVYVVYERKPKDEVALSEISLPHFFDWREKTTSFEDMAAFNSTNGSFTVFLDTSESISVDTARVSPSFFQTLGITPHLGRGFRPDEDQPESDHVVVLGYGFWQQVLGGEENVLGSILVMEGTARNTFTVVGVMPLGFEFPDRARLWIPLRKEDPIWPARGFSFLFAVARLAPAVSVTRAASELDALIPRLYREHDLPQAATRRSHFVPLSRFFLGEGTHTALWILEAAVGILFLIACFNVASLMLARTSSRHKEIAIRTALGASRRRLARAFLTETTILALAGGALGVVIARAALDVMTAMAPSGIPRLDAVAIDTSTVLFATTIAAASAVLVAFGPAIGSTQCAPAEMLAAVRASAPSRFVAMRQGLVFFQIAVTVFLVVGASLLTGGLYRLMQSDLGYRPERLILMSVKGPADAYDTPDKQKALLARSLERIDRLGAVDAVGAVLVPPFQAGTLGWDIWWVAESQDAPWETTHRRHPETGEMLAFFHPSREFMESNPVVNWEAVSGGYFQAMGIPLLRGRAFDDRDIEEAPRVVIVSESFAERLWPDEDPIGQRMITLGHRVDENRRSEWQTVVGVVGDARYREITGTRLDVYIPYQQSKFPPSALAVRTLGDPRAVVESVRFAVSAVDPNLRLERVRTMESVVDDQIAPRRFNTTLLGVFAGLALVLAALGVFGLLAQSVGQRTHEMGLRIALGARASDVIRLVVGQGMRLVLTGLVAGLVAAFLAARAMSAHLYEIAPTDPATYAGVSMLISIVAFVACYLPARRAARIDPSVALRAE